jgi:hypothetical protein
MNDAAQPSRRRRAWIGGLVASVVLIGLAVAVLLPAFGDYKPHATVSETVVHTVALREALAPSCRGGQFELTPQALDAAASRVALPLAVAGRNFVVEPGGAVLLELKMREVHWGAPWRQWSVAIPEGSTLVFNGTCNASQQFEWRLAKTTVPLEFLPRALRQ